MMSMYFMVDCPSIVDVVPVAGTLSLSGTEPAPVPRHQCPLTGEEILHQDSAAARLTPARTSMIRAAMREIQVKEMSLSRPRPPAMARPPTAHSARVAPVATDAGAW